MFVSDTGARKKRDGRVVLASLGKAGLVTKGHTMTKRFAVVFFTIFVGTGCGNRGSGGGPPGDGGQPIDRNSTDPPPPPPGDSGQPIDRTDPPPDASEPSCLGDFSIGSLPFSNSEAGLGMECNSSAPTNCLDGWFITVEGFCRCVAACSTFGLSEGDNCTTDGTWVCRHVGATNAGANHARLCVLNEWNLCLYE